MSFRSKPDRIEKSRSVSGRDPASMRFALPCFGSIGKFCLIPTQPRLVSTRNNPFLFRRNQSSSVEMNLTAVVKILQGMLFNSIFPLCNWLRWRLQAH